MHRSGVDRRNAASPFAPYADVGCIARRAQCTEGLHADRPIAAAAPSALRYYGGERETAERHFMGWSIKLFDVGGTAVRIHMTFFLLLAWIGAIHWTHGGAAAAVDGVLFIVALFVCVVLHEFGHVLAARRYGIATSDITLLPIGGVASLERMPEKPSQEIAVALA